jgi:topoisomerase-4 subunit B
MPHLIERGTSIRGAAVSPHHGGKTFYARNEAHRDELLQSEFRANANVRWPLKGLAF